MHLQKQQPTKDGQLHRWRKALKRFVLGALVLVILGVVVFGVVVKDYIRGLWSLKRVPETRMYVMDYYGTYNMGPIRTDGIDLTDIERSFVRNLLPKALVPIADLINGDTS